MPAKLWVDQAATQPVTLPAAPAGQAGATAQRNVYLANKGNTSLVISLRAAPRSDSVLQPQLWLDPSSGYADDFSGESAAAGYAFSHGSGESGGGAVTVKGAEGKPARYSAELQAPMRIRARLQRDRPCSNHFLVLSPAATPPTEPGGAPNAKQIFVCNSSVPRGPVSCCTFIISTF